ncbi:MAG TPA: DNA gyrase inhibitor YacG [Candidatus Binatia bacterium]|nr:DNA gyrase inhibitor YacG [Candidatus Binatia bacterium]
MTRTTRCPQCGAAVAPDVATRPFCSERCKMADLGAWFSGRYSIPADEPDSGLPQDPADSPKQ